MKIAFFGNFGVSYSSESHYLRTFEKLGHTVYTIQEKHQDIVDSTIEEILTCDMFFWVHTHSWSNNGIDELMLKLKEKSIPVVGYHLDLWLGLEREKDLDTDAYWKYLDYFFSVDKLMVEWLNTHKGMPKAFFLPAGVYEDECYISVKDIKYTHDVVFVGSRGYHKEWIYREKLIGWLEMTYGERFAQYGGGGLGTIRGDELNRLYASSKIVIGDTLCKDFEYPYYLSDRIFETTGRGGFIIHPYIKGIEGLFKIGDRVGEAREIVTYPFNNMEYLQYAIDYYLENENERELIRQAGFERTKKDHTYTNRLRYLIETTQNDISIQKQK